MWTCIQISSARVELLSQTGARVHTPSHAYSRQPYMHTLVRNKCPSSKSLWALGKIVLCRHGNMRIYTKEIPTLTCILYIYIHIIYVYACINLITHIHTCSVTHQKGAHPYPPIHIHTYYVYVYTYKSNHTHTHAVLPTKREHTLILPFIYIHILYVYTPTNLITHTHAVLHTKREHTLILPARRSTLTMCTMISMQRNILSMSARTVLRRKCIHGSIGIGSSALVWHSRR